MSSMSSRVSCIMLLCGCGMMVLLILCRFVICWVLFLMWLFVVFCLSCVLVFFGCECDVFFLSCFFLYCVCC